MPTVIFVVPPPELPLEELEEFDDEPHAVIKKAAATLAARAAHHCLPITFVAPFRMTPGRSAGHALLGACTAGIRLRWRRGFGRLW
jgi:hypothetical protein